MPEELRAQLDKAIGLHDAIAADVWPYGFTLVCQVCQRRERHLTSDGAQYLRHGWPVCCGQTMLLVTVKKPWQPWYKAPKEHTVISSLNQVNEMMMTPRQVAELFGFTKQRAEEMARQNQWRSWNLKPAPYHGPRVYYAALDVWRTYRQRETSHAR